jgi:fructosamine-3-kinase
MTEAIGRALSDAGIDLGVTASRDLSGGCIHRVRELTLADGTSLVAKVNAADRLAMFEEEAAGLRALAATKTVLVPRPIAVTRAGDTAVLLMTAIKPARATAASWRRFGAELAALHRSEVGPSPAAYGFETDNHLGTTHQPNAWCDDWVRFNAEHRLGHQLALAGEQRLLRGDETSRIQRVIDRLEALVPRHPKPALLHGDLWSGNALSAVDEQADARIAVIDPACSIGDGLADIAMMRLFGGFSEGCFEAYAGQLEDDSRLESRLAVYQLYHLLNHVNLFGRAYAGQAMAVADRLVGEGT